MGNPETQSIMFNIMFATYMSEGVLVFKDPQSENMSVQYRRIKLCWEYTEK